MKKIYKKPMIIFEDFSLSANIADCVGTSLHALTVCDQTATFSNYNSCKFYELGGNVELFLTTNSCGTSAQEGGICYDIPNDTLRVFGS